MATSYLSPPQIKLPEREMEQLLLLPWKHPSTKLCPCPSVSGRLRPSWVLGVFIPDPSRLCNVIRKPLNLLVSCSQIPLSTSESKTQEPCCHDVHHCPFRAWPTQARQRQTEPFGTEGSADAAHLFYFVIFVLQSCGLYHAGRTGVQRSVGTQKILVHEAPRLHAGKILLRLVWEKEAYAFVWVLGLHSLFPVF